MGTTGSGKSTLAMSLLRQCDHIFAIDPKGDLDIPGRVITDPNDLTRVSGRDPRTIIYRPHPEFFMGGWYNAVFRWLYERRNCTVYIDEMYGVMEGKSIAPTWLLAILTRGRSLKIRTIACTQRPFKIPIELLSESEHRFMFELDMVDDKKRMAELMPRMWEEEGRKPVPIVFKQLSAEHAFLYFNKRKPREGVREFNLVLRG